MAELLSTSEVSSLLGVSESTIGNKVAEGSFPAPLNIGGKRVWTRSRIDKYIAEAEQAADEQTISNQATSMTAIRVPRAQSIHRPLKSYFGPNAEHNAYIAGGFGAAVIYNSDIGHKIMRQAGIRISGSMSTDNNSGGGFLVPEEMQQAIITLRESRGIFPQFANNVPMSADISRAPRLLTDITAAWGTEGGTIAASDPTLGEFELRASKLSAYCKTSSELDEDSLIDLGDSLTFSMASAMAAKVDDAAFNGDGTSAYGGTLGLAHALDAAAIYDAASGNTGADTIDAGDLEATMGLCGEYAEANARWFCHRKVYFKLAALMSAAGMPTTLPDGNGGVEPILLGYPVSFVQAMPSTTTASPSTILAYFGDLRLGATYGTRRALRTELSTQRYFETDQIAVKNTERVAIAIHERGDSANNRPIVALKTAAA